MAADQLVSKLEQVNQQLRVIGDAKVRLYFYFIVNIGMLKRSYSRTLKCLDAWIAWMLEA